MSIFGAEVIGTALLILLGDGVVAAVLLNHSKAQNSGWIVITFGWAMGVMAGVFAVGQFSGAHLNPAVTLGFAVIGNTEWEDVPKYLGGEFVGAMIGATLVYLAYLNHWKETEDPGLNRARKSEITRFGNPFPKSSAEAAGTRVRLHISALFVTSASNNSTVVAHGRSVAEPRVVGVLRGLARLAERDDLSRSRSSGSSLRKTWAVVRASPAAE